MEVEVAYEACEAMTRLAARNFSYGIRLLPAGKRGALAAVYAFARRIDDIGDGSASTADKLEQLEQARLALKNAHRGDTDPVLVALADASERLPLPLDAFDDLIEGVRMDVEGHTYATFGELVRYCRCVAGSIGRLSLGVFGAADPQTATPLADALGVALQLTNIARDVREDLTLGRVYLPLEALEPAGGGVRPLFLDDDGFVADDGHVVAAVRRTTAVAEQWYAEGLALLPLLDRRSAASCAAMAGIYHRLLHRIERSPEQVLRSRISLPRREKLFVAARSLAGAAP